jgi:hypothetical protein
MKIIKTRQEDLGTYNVINPRTIDKFPCVVLSQNVQSIIGSAINAISHGAYSHIMWQIDKDTMASQEPIGFVKRGLENFTTAKHKLKFFEIVDATDRLRIGVDINARLELPWWKRRYDYLGILGQWLHIPCIQNPNAYFCSELEAVLLNKYCGLNLPLHTSPSELNKLFKNIQCLKLLGYWFID